MENVNKSHERSADISILIGLLLRVQDQKKLEILSLRQLPGGKQLEELHMLAVAVFSRDFN